MEKPVLGRGLDSLISGGSGRRASDLLSSFQAKRTRVAPGLKSFLQGAVHAPAPPTSTPAPKAETPAAPVPNPLRLKRAQRPRPAPTPPRPSYRPTRPPRATGLKPAEKKNQPQPDPETGAVHSSAEPAFQRPLVRKRPTYLKSGPAPEPPPESVTSPGLRLSFFIVDWFLMFVGFMVVWHATPPISWLTISLAGMAVIIGAALGTWALMPELGESSSQRKNAAEHIPAAHT